MTFDIDDPRLTAFALGELPEAERTDIEKALADHPDLAREVEQIRLTARWLTEQLHDEQAREVVATAAPAGPDLKLVAEAPRTAWFRRPPWWVSALAASLILAVTTGLMLPAIQSARKPRYSAYKQWIIPDTRRASKRAPTLEEAPSGSFARSTLPGWARNQLAGERPAPAVALGRRRASESHSVGHAGTQDLSLSASSATGTPAQTPASGSQGGPSSPGSPSRALRSPQGASGGMQALGMMGGMASPPSQDKFKLAPGANAPNALPPLDSRQSGAQPRSNQPAEAQAPFTDMSDRDFSGRGVEMVAADKAQAGLAFTKKAEAVQERAEGFVAEMQSVDKPAAATVDRDGSQPEARLGKLMEAEAVKPEPVSSPAPAPVVEENPFILTSQEAASTFAIDVDTASYSIVRRSLMEQNRLPNPDEVRIEEMLNYFPYQDAPPPAESPDPFAIHVEPARCPWNAANRLARIGIKGRPLGQEARKPSNLVFLVDVSGSMDQPNKLPLVQWGLQKLVEQLGENDRVAVAVYAGSSGLVLPSTSAMNKPAILSKIEELRAGGSTNGGAGIQLAYDQAAAGFISGGVNRVILATDGDFNVGVTNQDELVRLVESKAKGEKPIFLTVLGFGMDNLKDGTLEKLADKGNGHYAYIDRPEEAYKVLVEEMGATLDVIAKDVKIQVEFKPELVRAYRLVGYENRVMPNQDFRDDQKDGGEIGAGHHVTALYEYVPAEAAPATPVDGGPSPASFTVRLRYKQPEGDAATEIERPVVDRGVDYADASDDFKFASSVAGFGMILRHSPSVGSLTLPGVIELASPTLAHDPGGYRREFMALVQRARDIQSPPLAAPANP